MFFRKPLPEPLFGGSGRNRGGRVSQTDLSGDKVAASEGEAGRVGSPAQPGNPEVLLVDGWEWRNGLRGGGSQEGNGAVVDGEISPIDLSSRSDFQTANCQGSSGGT